MSPLLGRDAAEQHGFGLRNLLQAGGTEGFGFSVQTMHLRRASTGSGSRRMRSAACRTCSISVAGGRPQAEFLLDVALYKRALLAFY